MDEIANWLYLNGIEYAYDPKYEHKTWTLERRQCKPDFYLPGLTAYIKRFYNPKRRHSTLGYVSPMEFENQGVLA